MGHERDVVEALTHIVQLPALLSGESLGSVNCSGDLRDVVAGIAVNGRMVAQKACRLDRIRGEPCGRKAEADEDP